LVGWEIESIGDLKQDEYIEILGMSPQTINHLVLGKNLIYLD